MAAMSPHGDFPFREFIPVSRADMDARGWERCDFVFVSGDAYVDHPSFGSALLSRYLESLGYRVGILSQPDWRDPAAFAALGEPRLCFLVSSGNMDSMVNHYTANRKPRSEDAYSPGGKAGRRPDRALVAYCNAIRRAFPGTAIVIGGIEASLRRMTHYDYWSDTLKKSVLLDAKADLLVYGMGERAMKEIAEGLAAGKGIKELRGLRGTVWRTGRAAEVPVEAVLLPSHEEQCADKAIFAKAFMEQYRNTDPIRGGILAEPSAAGFAVQNPPARPLETGELDALYELPYTRSWHPRYAQGVPALSEVKFSLLGSRGCFGSCSFCALAFHQGRQLQSRSPESLVRETELLCRLPDFKGIINDLGGPTANFTRNPCEKMAKTGACPERNCLVPEPCPRLKADHSDYLKALRAVKGVNGVKKVFIRSGIRFDYLMLDRDSGFLEELCRDHVSGQLKTAPEHVSPLVLRAMGKPGVEAYRSFAAAYLDANKRLGLKQYLVPYYISAHPGSSLKEAIELACELKASGFVPDQVQDFYPTPGTISSCMYYTGLDPNGMEPIYVARGARERNFQRALLQFNKSENRALVIEALKEAGREDLIGNGPACLVRPF
jgi:uncharacterized radical SAM protein YgiQ